MNTAAQIGLVIGTAWLMLMGWLMTRVAPPDGHIRLDGSVSEFPMHRLTPDPILTNNVEWTAHGGGSEWVIYKNEPPKDGDEDAEDDEFPWEGSKFEMYSGVRGEHSHDGATVTVTLGVNGAVSRTGENAVVHEDPFEKYFDREPVSYADDLPKVTPVYPPAPPHLKPEHDQDYGLVGNEDALPSSVVIIDEIVQVSPEEWERGGVQISPLTPASETSPQQAFAGTSAANAHRRKTFTRKVIGPDLVLVDLPTSLVTLDDLSKAHQEIRDRNADAEAPPSLSLKAVREIADKMAEADMERRANAATIRSTDGKDLCVCPYCDKMFFVKPAIDLARLDRGGMSEMG